MITELTKAEVIELGARNRASYLLEQYGYTMGLAKMEKMLKLVEANADNLPGTSLKPLLKDGLALVDGIKAVDATQELNKLSSLPKAVQNFYFHKGLLFIGIKVINDAGRELHAHDAAAAARYNLSILYRNTHRKKSGTKETAVK
jgi:hypothetical protein